MSTHAERPIWSKVWGEEDLAELKALNRDLDGDRAEIGSAIGTTRDEADRLLNSLTGRTPAQARRALLGLA